MKTKEELKKELTAAKASVEELKTSLEGLPDEIIFKFTYNSKEYRVVQQFDGMCFEIFEPTMWRQIEFIFDGEDERDFPSKDDLIMGLLHLAMKGSRVKKTLAAGY